MFWARSGLSAANMSQYVIIYLRENLAKNKFIGGNYSEGHFQ